MAGPILVTGATGKQGGAVVRALLELAQPPSAILAVTRNPASAGAQKLAAASPSIKLVQGDLDKIPELFKAAQAAAGQPIWGVYSVQLGQGLGNTDEEGQGKALIDQSLSNGVKHFVYSSVDRGGNDKSWTNPTTVPHFVTKHAIELHLRDKAEGSGMGWTILRPVAFMDNIETHFQTRVFLAALKSSLGPKKLQWVAVRDIGVFAAKAFEQPDKFNHQAIGLAGDEASVDDLAVLTKAATGKALTPTFAILGSALMLAMKEMRVMIEFMADEGYGINIAELKHTHPALMDFKTWIVKESDFPTTA